jgi:DNA repair protein RadA
MTTSRKKILNQIEKDVKSNAVLKEQVEVKKQETMQRLEEELKKRDEINADLNLIPRIGPKTVEKLHAMGVHNIWDLATSSSPAIFEMIGAPNITQEFCTNLVISANRYLQERGGLGEPLVSAKVLLDNQMVRKRFSTGDKGLDEFFGGGGIESKAMTEVYGKFQTGKSQICYSTAAATASTGKKVLFLDTEGTFSPTRIQEIAEEKGYDVDKTLENILARRLGSSSMFEYYMKEITTDIQNHKFELIVVDSIIALHRAEFLGRASLAARQQSLAKIMGRLIKIAEAYDLAVLITNQVGDSPDPFKPGIFATGGNIVAHTSTHRIYLKTKPGKKETTRNGKKEKRDMSTILMQDSPRYARIEALMTMGRDGVRLEDASKLDSEEE